MTPVVFLDIDGVLNTPKQYAEWHAAHEGKAMTPATIVQDHPLHDERLFGAEHVECLNTLTRESGAQIVLSSTWRFFYAGMPGNGNIEDLRDLFRRVGITARVDSLTPPDIHHRGDAIVAWLRFNCEGGEVGDARYVILDDEPVRTFPSALRRYVVNTDGAVGLREQHVRMALRVIAGKIR